MSASAYTALVGAPPLPTTFAFRSWVYNLFTIRLANCPLARATTYWYAQSGSDSNDGLDGLGFNLSSATWTPGTLTLNKTNAFTSYTWKLGDQIYISGGTGLTTGLYTVASKTDGSNIVLASSPGPGASNVTTSSGPFKTISKLNTMLASGTRHRMNRGDLWNETWTANSNTVAIYMNGIANCTIDTYGYGPKPLVHNFTKSYTSGWTQAGVTDRWTRTEGSTIAWVRLATDRLNTVYENVTTTTLVENTPGSWYWDGTTLHVNVGTGLNPNNYSLEAVLSNLVNGLLVNGACNGSRVQDIRFDGFGLSTDHTQTPYNIKLNLSANNEFVLYGCEAYYGGYHAIGCTDITGNGIYTLAYCKAGYTSRYTNGETEFVMYSGSGSNECIWYRCEAVYGTLPDSTWVTSSLKLRGQSFYSHGSATAALILNWYPVAANNQWGCNSGVDYNPNYVPVATTIDQSRCFIVGEQILNYTSIGDKEFSPNGVYINGRYELTATTQPCLTGTTVGAWFLNCSIDIDCSKLALSSEMCLANSGQPHSFNFWHSRWIVRRAAALYSNSLIASFANPSTYGPNCTMFNSVFGTVDFLANVNTVLTGPNLVNNSANLGGNAYLNCLTYNGSAWVPNITGQLGHDADASRIELTATSLFPTQPPVGDPLYRAGVALPGGYALEYDANWNPRNTGAPTIGPVTDVYSAGGGGGNVLGLGL